MSEQRRARQRSTLGAWLASCACYFDCPKLDVTLRPLLHARALAWPSLVRPRMRRSQLRPLRRL